MYIIKKLISFFLLLVVIAISWMLYFSITPIDFKVDQKELNINAGSSLKSVGTQLVNQGVLNEPWSFVFLVRLLSGASQIKAGSYLLDNGITPYQLFLVLTNGSNTQTSITFIEGWTFAQMRHALNKHESVKHMTMAYTDRQIMEEIDPKVTEPEGMFFPDTYYFSAGMSDKEILKRAYLTMQNRLTIAWENRQAGLPYKTPYDALIMASIVEKETGKASERPEIAGVFLNRLRIGMRLQTDPSVIYGLGTNFDGNLRKQDLLNDNPYNTYTRGGLPPTPIAMPGIGAIAAALHPAQTKSLYFVGKGDGSHIFSTNLNDHNNAVARYQLRKQNNAR